MYSDAAGCWTCRVVTYTIPELWMRLPHSHIKRHLKALMPLRVAINYSFLNHLRIGSFVLTRRFSGETPLQIAGRVTRAARAEGLLR